MNKIKRKLQPLVEDIREYWLARFTRRASVVSFWTLAFLGALVLLPFSPERRRRYAVGMGNAVGGLLWEFRGIGALREWFPPMRNMVRIVHRRASGELVKTQFHFNLRPTAGRDWQTERMGASTTTNPANYITVHSSTPYTPVAGTDITEWELVEETGFGFGRQQAVYAHTPGNANYTLVHTYTATGTVTIYGAALIDEDTSPSEAVFVAKNFGTQADMENNDTLECTWDITV